VFLSLLLFLKKKKKDPDEVLKNMGFEVDQFGEVLKLHSKLMNPCIYLCGYGILSSEHEIMSWMGALVTLSWVMQRRCPLIDSGSTHSFVSPQVIKAPRLSIVPCYTRMKVTVANGQIMYTLLSKFSVANARGAILFLTLECSKLEVCDLVLGKY